MAEKISIKLPSDLLELTGLNPDSLEKRSLLIWVLELYSEGKVSLSKAADLVNMKNDEFLTEFYKRHLKRIGGPKDKHEAEEDFEVIQKIIED
ncbi:MAG: hypothetical protein GF308_08425 [Candidatus Heimdallarchaeota archaeon]|nr:hypothetical protein [Candidatus Heimdallarchaeota archaeon]